MIQNLTLPASPLATRLAAARGMDLAAVRGTGPGGRVVKADLFPARTPTSVARTTLPPLVTRALAPLQLAIDVDLDPLLAIRARLNAAAVGASAALSLDDLLVRALAATLAEMPQAIPLAGADIAIAIAIAGAGPFMPVIRDADSKSASAVARERVRLAERARTGGLSPEECEGGIVGLSNLGRCGITRFDAAIRSPQVMMLCVGAGVRRTIVSEETVVIATVATIVGSFDLDAINETTAASLMTALKRLVEAPLTLLV